MFFKSVLQDTLSLFYPQLCAACDDLLQKGEDVICTRCRIMLPYTGYQEVAENPVAKQFWGKVHLQGATAFFHFQRGEKVQHLIHRLKYEGRQDVGVCVGRICGAVISTAFPYSSVDFIIPIPLHRKKEKLRGYNQAACFSDGLSETMGVPSLSHGMKRVKHTATQTRKSRFARYSNVNEVFEVTDQEKLIGKHILLVDDVITTGSTLSACAQVLLKLPEVRVSIAAIAFAEI
jgi:ComF family protein